MPRLDYVAPTAWSPHAINPPHRVQMHSPYHAQLHLTDTEVVYGRICTFRRSLRLLLTRLRDLTPVLPQHVPHTGVVELRP